MATTSALDTLIELATKETDEATKRLAEPYARMTKHSRNSAFWNNTAMTTRSVFRMA